MTQQAIPQEVLSQVMTDHDIAEAVAERDKHGLVEAPFLYEEITGPNEEVHRLVHFYNPHDEYAVPITLRTLATEEEVNKIAAQVIAMPETCEIFSHLAEAFQANSPLILEGGTALGKTFAVQKFTQLLFGTGPEGESLKPLDFYCNGQTDVSELMAKWVPKTSNSSDEAALERYLDSDEGKKAMTSVHELTEKMKGASDEEIKEAQIAALAKIASDIGVDSGTQWEFQLGALPKAMCWDFKDGKLQEDTNGSGFVLHVEEVGLAKPSVVNALLEIRGSNGKHAENIQLWQNGGRTIPVGESCFIVFSTNPPESYAARNEIDQALARGARLKRLGDLSEESLTAAAGRYMTYTVGNQPEEILRPRKLDLTQHPEIGEAMAEITAKVHAAYIKALEGGEPGRVQRVPATLDDFARVAEDCANLQVGSGDRIDLPKTLKRALRSIYLERLVPPTDEDTNDHPYNSIKSTIEAWMDGAAGEIDHPTSGQRMTRSEYLDSLAEAAYAKMAHGSEAPEPMDIKATVRDAETEEKMREVKEMMVSIVGMRAAKAELGLDPGQGMNSQYVMDRMRELFDETTLEPEEFEEAADIQTCLSLFNDLEGAHKPGQHVDKICDHFGLPNRDKWMEMFEKYKEEQA